MLKDSNVISLQISIADITQQIVWIGSSSIRTVRTFVSEPGIPGILGVRVTRRGDFMSYFRGGDGEVALLTRDYSGDGEHWGEHIFNISVNEALRTRGDAAVSVIEKELGQMIAKLCDHR